MNCVCCKNPATRKCSADENTCGADLCTFCVHKYSNHYTESNLKGIDELLQKLSDSVNKNYEETKVLTHKLKCSDIHRLNLEADVKKLTAKHERDVEYLSQQSKKRFWRKFLPPSIKISFRDEYDE